jgi:hypothetical protein
MAIIVVCPGCRKSFKVSEKFAGRTGNCPSCKHTIRVPSPKEEVKIHAPTEFASGGKSVTGELITKPIPKKVAQLDPVMAVTIAVAALGVLLVTWVVGKIGLFRHWSTTAIGLLVVSPPLVVAGYGFLRDDEREPYRGMGLYIRSGICAVVYAALWGVFGYLGVLGILSGELWTWVFIVPPFLLVGGVAAFATLDLDYGNAVLHYAFYAIVTLLLRVVAQIPPPWQETAG